MVSLSEIAIFILATTRGNGNNQHNPTYFESRILPIHDSWGSYFENLFFVFGTNEFDFQFLKRHCEVDIGSRSTSIKTKSATDSRKLKAHTPQTPSQDKLVLYKCYGDQLDNANSERAYTIKGFRGINSLNHRSRGASSKSAFAAQKKRDSEHDHFKVLFCANCTGEYFGYGPSCRYQEALRYFQWEEKLKTSKWFLFMDDDIYLRPFALASMLSQLDNNNSTSSTANTGSTQRQTVASGSSSGSDSSSTSSVTEPSTRGSSGKRSAELGEIAIVSGNAYRGLKFSKAWRTPEIEIEKNISCSVPTVHDFAFAQPLILNRAATNALRSSTDANAYTALQTKWGGSHDFIVGFVLWLYGLPVFSMYRSYYGDKIVTTRLSPPSSLLSPSAAAKEEKRVDRSHSKSSSAYGVTVAGLCRSLSPKQNIDSGPLMYHKVMSFVQYKWNKTSSSQDAVADIADMYDITCMLNEEHLLERFLSATPAAKQRILDTAVPSVADILQLFYTNNKIDNYFHTTNMTLLPTEVPSTAGVDFVAALVRLLQHPSSAGLLSSLATTLMQKQQVSITSSSNNNNNNNNFSSTDRSSSVFKTVNVASTSSGANLTKEELFAIAAQLSVAERAVLNLVPMSLYGVFKTKYFQHAENIRSNFVLFAPDDCLVVQ